MRLIDKLILHCDDTNNPKHNDIEVIRGWHINERHFADVGYHFFIKTDGEIQNGRPIEHIGAHCENFNKTSIGICLHGKNKEDFTKEQFEALAILIQGLQLKLKFGNDRIYPHHHFNAGKTCPNFDIKKFIEEYLA